MKSKTPTKTVHITNYYHETSGGIRTAYSYLLEAANRHEQFARLIVPGESDDEKAIGSYGKIYFIKSPNFPFFDSRYRVILPQMYMRTRSRIREILLAEQPDLIEVCDKYTISWMAGMIRMGKFSLLERPALVHMSCERMDDNVRAFITKMRIGNRLSKIVMKNLIYPMFDFYAANSAYTLSELSASIGNACCKHQLEPVTKKFWRFFHGSEQPFSQRTFVNAPGVDTATFNPTRKSADTRVKLFNLLKVDPKDRILLYAGRISPEKNTGILPEIMAHLRSSPYSYKLVIAGDGPQRPLLEKSMYEIAPDIARFCGHVKERELLADLYANCDAFIHPNPREPFGIGPLESMASGTPVVAPNRGGVMTYCTYQNSWLVNGNADEFAIAIANVFDDPEIREIRVRRGSRTASEHSWERATDRILENYDQMISYFRLNQMNLS